MNRRLRIILIAVLFALIGVIIPLTAAFYLSWIRAVKIGKDELTEITHRVLTRTLITLNQTNDALLLLNSIKINQACSDAHINHMRKIMLLIPAVDEAGFFNNNILKCTTWGDIKDINIHPFKYDLIIRDGIKVTFKINSLIIPDYPLIAFQYKSYYVFVDPIRFFDIIIEPHIQIALATKAGQLIGGLNNPDSKLIKRLLTHSNIQSDDKYLFATAEKNGVVSYAFTPLSVIYEKFRYEQMFFIPIGVFIALFVIGLTIYYLRRRLSFEGDLLFAIDNNEFVAYYQPIIELKNEKCIGAEALIRWKRADGQIINPDLFIPMAEEMGMISKITHLMIDNVIKDLSKFLANNKDCHISINLSSEDFKSSKILDILKLKMEDAGISAQQIWIEATERGIMKLSSFGEIIHSLRQSGFVVAIDDFGTGYSNLSYLQHFSFDILKIDKLFVESIATDSSTSDVITHIIELAKKTNLKCVAEGIENKGQLDYLVEHQVEYGQGWLFSKAMPAEDFIEFFENKA